MLDYGKIINKSIDVVKRNKWLLIYGALLGGSLGSSGSGGGSSSTSTKTPSDIKSPDIKLKDIPSETSKVLGETIGSLTTWFHSISPATWALIILAVILIAIVSIVFGLVIRNWAKASLIIGAQMALAEKEVNLKNTSPLGKAKTKSLIIYSLIVIAIVWGTILALGLIGTLSYLLLSGNGALLALWGVFIVVPGVIWLVITLIMAAMTSIYAERLIVLDGYKPWDAWKKGLSLSKGNFIPTVVMGIINTLGTGIFGCLTMVVALVILGVPSFLLIYVPFSRGGYPPFISWVFMGLFIVALILTMTLVQAASSVFKHSNWNQVFETLKANEKEVKK